MNLYVKQNELIDKIREEIKELEEKKYALTQAISEKYSEINDIMDANFLDSDLMISSIEYLVNVVEKEEYKIKNFKTIKERNKPKYELKYLVKENKEKNEYEEVILKFKNSSDKTSLVEISSEKFSYINDYIDSLIDYRLEKTDFQITKEDTKKLADNFGENYNLRKSLALIYSGNTK